MTHGTPPAPAPRSAASDAYVAPAGGGRIVTFYSYKGGVGRSMVVAGTAWLLAGNGMRVLAIDWDLEAPGLHRYFHPFLPDPDLAESDGVIDMLHDLATAAPAADARGNPVGPNGAVNVLRYASSLRYRFPNDGCIDLVPAGRSGPSYATRVNAFNWEAFYGRLGGGAALEAVREQMREAYDYVLIDSRTGVGDSAGVCTVQMPDVLVLCFALNRQNVDGVAAVAAAVASQRPDLRILPVPMRVESAEKELLDRARHAAHRRLGPFLRGVPDPGRYWQQVEVPYVPVYAYQEVLPMFADKPGDPMSLSSAVERLAAVVTDGRITSLRPVPDSARRDLLRQYFPCDREETST